VEAVLRLYQTSTLISTSAIFTKSWWLTRDQVELHLGSWPLQGAGLVEEGRKRGVHRKRRRGERRPGCYYTSMQSAPVVL